MVHFFSAMISAQARWCENIVAQLRRGARLGARRGSGIRLGREQLLFVIMAILALSSFSSPILISSRVSSSISPNISSNISSSISQAFGLFFPVSLFPPAHAQISNDNRGIVPISDSDDFLVSGIDVDVTAATARIARNRAWRQAQRIGWQRLYHKTRRGGGGVLPRLSDATLASILSAVIIEQEQIAPNRYIARLNLLFNRVRAGPLLGVNSPRRRSPPLLVLPIYTINGLPQMFEHRNGWQRAWAEYNAGDSAIDYVRPIGTGTDTVLLNVGQTTRRSRVWWRVILDQYSAADVIAPTAHLHYSYPGGPIIGYFTAYFGPDKILIDQIILRADNHQALADMMRTAVARLDAIYSRAFRDGRLQMDPALTMELPRTESVSGIAGVAEYSNVGAVDSLDSANNAGAGVALTPILTPNGVDARNSNPAATTAAIVVTIEYPTADIAALVDMEQRIADIDGVESAATHSLSLGDISAMRLVYRGSRRDLRRALARSGLRVRERGTILRVE